MFGGPHLFGQGRGPIRSSRGGPWKDTTRFVLDQDAYETYQLEADGQGAEVGGTMSFDCSSLTMRPVATSIAHGEATSVDVPHGIIEFHVHHGHCRRKSEVCWFLVPSATDMVNIANDSTSGNWAHLIFSPEGTYVVRVGPELREKLRRGDAKGLLERLRADLEGRVKRFLDPSDPNTYDQFRDAWFVFVGQRGFDVDLFPRGVAPYVDLPTKLCRQAGLDV